MSGPIVRKYGFPNFESIFGKRELQHGIDAPAPSPPPAEPAGNAQEREKEPKPVEGPATGSE